MAQEAALMAMESQVNNASYTKKRSVRNDKLLLDDYIHFLRSRHSLDLTMCQLNQIIRIHGFKKIHHAPKKVLVDAVNSLDLVKLSRSTLHSSVVSAFAALTVEDAIADLNELNWQECCVTSLEKLCSSNNNHKFLFPPSSSDPHHSRLQFANHLQVGPKRKISGSGDGDETCCGGRELISEAFRSGMRPAKMVPRRKRSGAHAPSGAVCALSATVDSASLASSC
ncbi:uncharacterized protein LOC107648060 [Arachis ipaensis]|uniref:DUF7787 domain-containing protein n=1 Tax=Arachis hypogaea TaxID=3818 RepID=A0A444YLF1_ARAHY|nr:uncharacterized protein LOC107648060 [Arachis ipaensis]XP_025662633.1 uncharacterized protein LOC112758235 [Arachis hypogaea]QHN85539.1 uncharacterized protein DS421_16g538290 [Arachis hypogaea]RYR02741.1 hypothetical protein Ahy_B06g081552 [Arachis hypogaea]